MKTLTAVVTCIWVILAPVVQAATLQKPEDEPPSTTAVALLVDQQLSTEVEALNPIQVGESEADAKARALAEEQAKQKKKTATPKKAAVIPVPKAPPADRGPVYEIVDRLTTERWGEGEVKAMRELVARESGGNPYAKNKNSGACGIPQALPCSKLLAVVGTLDNIEGQVLWMILYVAGRYGTPSAAIRWHNAHNWY